MEIRYFIWILGFLDSSILGFLSHYGLKHDIIIIMIIIIIIIIIMGLHLLPLDSQTVEAIFFVIKKK